MPGPPRELVQRIYTTPPDRSVAIHAATTEGAPPARKLPLAEVEVALNAALSDPPCSRDR
ncbi:hypothetical protein [Micromonospora sp. DT47]|uniref:hypothetical protein n=1 Tax=Micromonospora sp. DT47 TaxID=3393431 RepID=UPI003CE70F17